MLFSIFFRFVMNIYVCSGATELLCTFRGIYSLQRTIKNREGVSKLKFLNFELLKCLVYF